MGHGHHHHGHHHHHHGDARGALTVALVLNAAFLVAEAAAGFWTGSLALLSDAAHMLSDVGALVLALAAAQLARRAADATMTFGLARAEVLGAFLNGLFLLAACGWIAFEAVGRLMAEAPPEIPGLPVLVIGGLGLAINLGSAVALWRSDRENLNVRGALAHMLADALGSVGAMVAALLLMAGMPAADAVISMLVAGLVAVSGVQLLRDAGRVLLQLPPAELDVGEVRDALTSVTGVCEVHDLHAWSLDGSHTIVSAHLVLAEAVDAEVACREAHERLAKLGIEHSTLQPERGHPCAVAGCGVSKVVSRVA